MASNILDTAGEAPETPIFRLQQLPRHHKTLSMAKLPRSSARKKSAVKVLCKIEQGFRTLERLKIRLWQCFLGRRIAVEPGRDGTWLGIPTATSGSTVSYFPLSLTCSLLIRSTRLSFHT